MGVAGAVRAAVRVLRECWSAVCIHAHMQCAYMHAFWGCKEGLDEQGTRSGAKRE